MARSSLFAVLLSLLVLVAILVLEIQKKPALSPKAVQQAGQVEQKLNHVFLKGGPLQSGLADAHPDEYITEETGTDVPSYTERSFTVRSGAVVSITLRNNSTVGHQHGWVLVTPGKRKAVQQAGANAGAMWHWIPDSTDVLAFVPLTNPGQSSTMLFRAPNPGDYPFFCPVPGHGNVMNGILHVVP